MSEGYVNNFRNGSTDDSSEFETDKDLQDYISVKGNMDDIAYAIKNLIEKGKESGGVFHEIAEYDFSENDYRLIAEFCVDIDSQSSEDENYQYSRVFPRLKRLVNIKPSLVLCVVATIVGLGANPLTFPGLCASVGGAAGSYIALKDCISEKIKPNFLCVLTSARGKGKGSIVTQYGLKRALKDCPYGGIYQTAYKERCSHCSYDPLSPTQYACDLTEGQILTKLMEIANDPQYGIEYDSDEKFFIIK